MGLVKLSTFSDYLSIDIRCPAIADSMACRRLNLLPQNFYFVNNKKEKEIRQWNS